MTKIDNMRTKGVGPRNLGIPKSPLKQDGKQKTEKHKQKLINSVENVPYEGPQGAAVGAGLIGGGGVALSKLGTRIAARLAKSPKTAKLANKILNFSKRKPKDTSNLRSDGFGGTTSVGSRRSYNNIGSN